MISPTPAYRRQASLPLKRGWGEGNVNLFNAFVLTNSLGDLANFVLITRPAETAGVA